ncbi:anion permease [Thalassobacillus cyri]|uniref:anion permease n=1 Tax=Thalassobacillus cyri TaxID=571932 RepID=UPI001FE03D6D|nr:anion permease [Thalassobacillus cyri]
MEKRKTLLLLSLAIYIVFFFPLFDWDIKVKAIAALFFIQILWIGRVFTLAFSSLLFILVLSFHFFSYEETLGYLGEEVVWLLFATYIISNAFIKTGLASRLSLTVETLERFRKSSHPYIFSPDAGVICAGTIQYRKREPCLLRPGQTAEKSAGNQ